MRFFSRLPERKFTSRRKNNILTFYCTKAVERIFPQRIHSRWLFWTEGKHRCILVFMLRILQATCMSVTPFFVGGDRRMNLLHGGDGTTGSSCHVLFDAGERKEGRKERRKMLRFFSLFTVVTCWYRVI